MPTLSIHRGKAAAFVCAFVTYSLESDLYIKDELKQTYHTAVPEKLATTMSCSEMCWAAPLQKTMPANSAPSPMVLSYFYLLASAHACFMTMG